MAMKMESPKAKATENLLTCPICLEYYVEPRSLTCLHTFCSSCLERLRNKSHPFIVCPMCKRNTRIPPSGIKGLPNDFKIEQMKDILKCSEQLDQTENQLCNVCKGADADFHCMCCSVFYCGNCVKKHNNNAVFNDHSVSHLPNKQTNSTFLCGKHPNHSVTFRCLTCKPRGMLCPICILDHDDTHDISDLNISAEAARISLKVNLEKVQARCNLMQDYLAHVREREKYYDEMLMKAQEDIIKQTARLVEVLHKEETKLLQEAQLRFQEKVANFKQQDVSSALANLENLQIELTDVIEAPDGECIKSEQKFSQLVKQMTKTTPIPEGQAETGLQFIPNTAEVKVSLGTFRTYDLEDPDVSEELDAAGTPAFTMGEGGPSVSKTKQRRCDHCNQVESPLISLYCLTEKREKVLCEACKMATGSVLILRSRSVSEDS